MEMEMEMERNGTMNERYQPRKVLYGLPCARCKTYYAGDLTSCPVCQCPERVSRLGLPAKQ